MRVPREIRTERLRLRPWRATDFEGFALMNADPVVMADLGGPIDRADSDAKLVHYKAMMEHSGLSRWAIESLEHVGHRFIGYAGVVFRSPPDHPLGSHYEIGWRLVRSAWGQGFATEAASAALDDAFSRFSLAEILSYTSPDNYRSIAVMQRLGLTRVPSKDFRTHYDGYGQWTGLVWKAITP